MAAETYQNRIKASELFPLLSATPTEFAKLKQENRVPKGIDRVEYPDLEDKALLGQLKIWDYSNITYLDNVEIDEDIFLSDNKVIFPIFFYKSKLNRIVIYNQDITKSTSSGNFYFYSSQIEHLTLFNSVIGKLTIYNSEFEKILLSTNSKTGDIEIKENCLFGELNCMYSSVMGDLRMVQTCIIREFYMRYNCRIGRIAVINSSIINFKAYTNNNLGTIEISENSTVDVFRVSGNCIMENIFIKKSLLGDVYINRSKVADIRIDNTSKTGDYSLLNNNIVSFVASDLYSSFRITSRIGLLQLTDCFIPLFEIGAGCNAEIYISGGQVNMLQLSSSSISKETVFSISRSYFYVIIIEELSVLGNLYFRQIKKADDVFNWFDINGEGNLADGEKNTIYLNEIKNNRRQILDNKKKKYEERISAVKSISKNAIIRISQSSLGKTEFTDCPLKEFVFGYNNSKITECSILGGTVPQENIEILNAEPNSKQWDEQMASIYNQFKKIFEAQGDIYQATQFQAKWASHQQSYLAYKRAEEREKIQNTGLHHRIASYFNETAQDIYTLWLNKVSNNHGESWIRALGLILGIGIVSYLLYLWSLGRCFNSNKFDWDLAGYYFEFLNPLHKSNFINETNKPSGLTISIDFLGKLLNSYFIYQFIAAFRKHGKKQ